MGWVQIVLTLLSVGAIAPWVGTYIARAFQGPAIAPEQWLYRFIRHRTDEPMTGPQYLRAVLASNGAIGLASFLLLWFQARLPLNPTGIGSPSWDLALHTTMSFLTNTDQQHYSGELAISYGSQVWVLGYLLFISAATGLAVGIAFIRGLSGQPLGNFYRDLTRSITRILLPLSIAIALVLLIAGVPETLAGPATVTTLEGASQTIARGPVAHFEAIKQLGENGGGFFAINSAHPFENPNGLTNWLEIWAMLLIPVSLVFTYGEISHNRRQAWWLFGLVGSLFVGLIALSAIGEWQGNPAIAPGPNLEGKEVRFGWAQTALWAVTTTSTMCGAVNGMHDSLMPTGGFATLMGLFLQIVWGGQGTGTAYLYIFLILTVFLTGLMVGRTPEFLGRKIEKREIVLASLVLLVHPIFVLIPGAIALAFSDSLAGISNPGFHGVSQVIYEYASAAANNGSGFEGLGDGTLWWNLSAVVSLLGGRYIPIAALLLLADGMAHKQPVPITPGTLRTDTALFPVVTGITILILGLLTFFPVLALGPIAEGFSLQ
ncbi:MAG TPA: potassium-transporting ATPase subunit KdpA [Coleofasciculaceae cyanobacterium]